MVKLGKEACTDLAVGGEANSTVLPAKGLRHGCDDADLAHAVVEGLAERRLSGDLRGQLYQRTKSLQTTYHFVEWNNRLRSPYAILFQRHELDKTNNYVVLSRKLREGNNLVVIETTQYDTIDLDR